jgi:hypothetical protein
MLLPAREHKTYYRDVFPDSLDFQQFCYELYSISDWKMIIAKAFNSDKSQKYVKRLIKDIIDDEILLRQTILNRTISEDFNIDWNLPRWGERAYSRIK